MDKITHSDKFKQMKLNVTDTKRVNSFKNTTNLKNSAKCRLQVLQQRDQNCIDRPVKSSPRRFPETKHFGINKLVCSFRNKSSSIASSSDRLGESENSILLTDNSRQVSKSRPNPIENKYDEKRKYFAQKNERDSSGFLKPLAPAPKNNLPRHFMKEQSQPTNDTSVFLKNLYPAPVKNSHEQYVKDQLEITQNLLNRLTDLSIFHEVEIEFHIHKLLQKTISAISKKCNVNVAPQNCAPTNRIQSWLNSVPDSSNIPDSRMENLDKSSKIHSQSTEFTIGSDVERKKNVFLLRDWTVIKGSGETELMVSGELLDVCSRKVLENKHSSSSIIEKIGNNSVRTICCVYQLFGNFVDKGVPQEIKKYFESGKFPEDWKRVSSKWHSLNSSLSSKETGNSSKNSSKRILEDLYNKSDYIYKTKRMRTVYADVEREA